MCVRACLCFSTRHLTYRRVSNRDIARAPSRDWMRKVCVCVCVFRNGFSETRRSCVLTSVLTCYVRVLALVAVVCGERCARVTRAKCQGQSPLLALTQSHASMHTHTHTRAANKLARPARMGPGGGGRSKSAGHRRGRRTAWTRGKVIYSASE